MDPKRRISMKVPRANQREGLLAMGPLAANEARADYGLDPRVRDAALDAAPVAQVVVDVHGALVLANERARVLFGLTGRDLGRPLQDLMLSYRPVGLRSVIEQAFAERRVVHIKDMEWRQGEGDARWFDIELCPLVSAAGSPLGVTITFLDSTTAKRLQQELERSNQELETAYEELQSTYEELETTNEELQSTVEELETTNEELQSTNEELVTMNEELQTINDELRLRSEELNKVNALLDPILRSLRGAVVVVDPELRVLVWNALAEDLWGLRAEEAEGKHLLNLDIGLPVERLKQPIRRSIAGDGDGKQLLLRATDRRGEEIDCAVEITPLVSAGRDVRGVILLMEPAAHESGPGARERWTLGPDGREPH